jgi:pyruvate/2-oxoglutarate dehydrogenase complex dihydrolipoamide acyltransferase (E2) component
VTHGPAVEPKALPIFNSSIEGTDIVHKRDVNIGVAVAHETGLLVPAIKRGREKFPGNSARGSGSRRSKRRRVEDVHDANFTITNPGVFGGLLGPPIIDQPQVAILAVGTVQQRPVVRDDAIVIRPMVYLSLSYDHRLVDGEVGAQFLVRLKTLLEDWNEPVL